MNVASVLGKRLVGSVLSSGDRVERNQHGIQQIWYGTVPGKGKAATVCIGTVRQMLQIQEPPLCFPVWWDTRSLSRPFSMLLRHAAVSFLFIYLETALVALIKAHERQPNGQEDVQHIGSGATVFIKTPVPSFPIRKKTSRKAPREDNTPATLQSEQQMNIQPNLGNFVYSIPGTLGQAYW